MSKQKEFKSRDYGSWAGHGGGTATVMSHSHKGTAVPVGPRASVLAAAGRSVRPDDLKDVDIVVMLSDAIKHDVKDAIERGWMGLAVDLPMKDYDCWDPDVLREQAKRALRWCEAGHRVLVCCTGGHGRTGTFIAAMIALAEADGVDPIEAVRARHCDHAVETFGQIKAVFAVRGQEIPEKWKLAFQNGSRFKYTGKMSLDSDFFRKEDRTGEQSWWKIASKTPPQGCRHAPRCLEGACSSKAKSEAAEGTSAEEADEAWEESIDDLISCKYCLFMFNPAQAAEVSTPEEQTVYRVMCPSCGDSFLYDEVNDVTL
jgi:hypothetical protein